MRRDALVDLVGLGIRQENLVGIALGEHVDVAFRDERILRGDGQPRVDLRDDAARRGDERRDEIRHHADREVTGLRVRPHAKQHDVDADRARAHERRHRRHVSRDDVGDVRRGELACACPRR